MRVLVTGSRGWPAPREVHTALWGLYWQSSGDFIVVHGACPTGADAAASWWVDATWTDPHSATEEKHPADWRTHGKAAGPLRNKRMVELGADVCLAFIKDNSRGATGCAEMAIAAGIDTRIWRL